MKRSFLLLTVLLLVLAGCFGKQAEQKPAAEEQASGVESPQSVKNAPTLADGDIYLEALAKKDAKLCVGISNAALQKKCSEDVQ